MIAVSITTMQRLILDKNAVKKRLDTKSDLRAHLTLTVFCHLVRKESVLLVSDGEREPCALDYKCTVLSITGIWKSNGSSRICVSAVC